MTKKILALEVPAAGDAAAIAATVVIAAADAAVAVILVFASWPDLSATFVGIKQHDPFPVDGVWGVGDENITSPLVSGYITMNKDSNY